MLGNGGAELSDRIWVFLAPGALPVLTREQLVRAIQSDCADGISDGIKKGKMELYSFISIRWALVATPVGVTSKAFSDGPNLSQEWLSSADNRRYEGLEPTRLIRPIPALAES